MFEIKPIRFDEILPIWRDRLWPNRKSDIETHSAMTWPMSFPMKPYDMDVFNYSVSFLGVFFDDKLIAVNSGHLTSPTDFRSRGLWVDPEFRKKGIGTILLNATVATAIENGANKIWSLPRVTSINPYLRAGFTPVYSIPVVSVEFGPNVYVMREV